MSHNLTCILKEKMLILMYSFLSGFSFKPSIICFVKSLSILSISQSNTRSVLKIGQVGFHSQFSGILLSYVDVPGEDKRHSGNVTVSLS